MSQSVAAEAQAARRLRDIAVAARQNLFDKVCLKAGRSSVVIQ